jgi:hypothetical protein
MNHSISQESNPAAIPKGQIKLTIYIVMFIFGFTALVVAWSLWSEGSDAGSVQPSNSVMKQLTWTSLIVHDRREPIVFCSATPHAKMIDLIEQARSSKSRIYLVGKDREVVIYPDALVSIDFKPPVFIGGRSANDDQRIWGEYAMLPILLAPGEQAPTTLPIDELKKHP